MLVITNSAKDWKRSINYKNSHFTVPLSFTRTKAADVRQHKSIFCACWLFMRLMLTFTCGTIESERSSGFYDLEDTFSARNSRAIHTEVFMMLAWNLELELRALCVSGCGVTQLAGGG